MDSGWIKQKWLPREMKNLNNQQSRWRTRLRKWAGESGELGRPERNHRQPLLDGRGPRWHHAATMSLLGPRCRCRLVLLPMGVPTDMKGFKILEKHIQWQLATPTYSLNSSLVDTPATSLVYPKLAPNPMFTISVNCIIIYLMNYIFLKNLESFLIFFFPFTYQYIGRFVLHNTSLIYPESNPLSAPLLPSLSPIIYF